MRITNEDREQALYKQVKELEAKLDLAIEALEFYAQATTLMFTTGNSEFKARDPKLGIIGSGMNDGISHYKDDGERARDALRKILK